jgi:hypothetical protein
VSLTIAQRLFVWAALPTELDDEEVLVFEDDGGGWHNDPAVETWVSFTVNPGPRYLYNIRSQLNEYWDATILKFTQERGQLHQGTISLYVCSTDKRTVQLYENLLVKEIEPGRLGLSLDVEGVTTGPEPPSPKPLGSYSDYRLRKRVYRTLIEIPILYKFSELETGEIIKTIEVEPWIGVPQAEMDHYFLHAPLLLAADMLLAESTQSALEASIVLEL